MASINWGWLPIAVCVLGCARKDSNTTVTVFAAASLTDTVTEIARDYERAHPGERIATSFGGSQDLAKDIEAGAPADVFCCAGSDWLNELASKGFVTANSETEFASNRLCVVVPKSNPANIDKVEELTRSGLKLVLAAPQVPAGKAARTWMKNRGGTFLADASKNVRSEETSVRNVLTKVELGEADAGVVYVTDATSAGSKVREIAIPDRENVRVKYLVAPVQRVGRSAGAEGFVRYLSGPDSSVIIRSKGFDVAKARE